MLPRRIADVVEEWHRFSVCSDADDASFVRVHLDAAVQALAMARRATSDEVAVVTAYDAVFHAAIAALRLAGVHVSPTPLYVDTDVVRAGAKVLDVHANDQSDLEELLQARRCIDELTASNLGAAHAHGMAVAARFVRLAQAAVAEARGE